MVCALVNTSAETAAHPFAHPFPKPTTLTGVQGSIIETPKGSKKWRLRVYIGTDGRGKKRYNEKRFTGSKRQAQEALRALVIEAGKMPAEQVTVGELIERYIDHREPALSPSTITAYRRLTTAITPDLGHLNAAALKPTHIDAWTKRRLDVVSGNTHMKAWALLHASLAQGVKWELLERNPADRATRPKVQKWKPQQLTMTEIERVQSLQLPPWFAVCVALAVGSGQRRSQLAALQWQDIQGDVIVWQRRAIHSDDGVQVLPGTKSQEEVITPISADLRQILDAWRLAQTERCRDGFDCELSPNAFVLGPPPGDRPIRPDTITQQWGRSCAKAGLAGFRFHDLRHFVGTKLIAAGVDVRTVAELMGHRDATVTLQVYAHTDIDRMRAAMEQAGIK